MRWPPVWPARLQTAPRARATGCSSLLMPPWRRAGPRRSQAPLAGCSGQPWPARPRSRGVDRGQRLAARLTCGRERALPNPRDELAVGRGFARGRARPELQAQHRRAAARASAAARPLVRAPSSLRAPPVNHAHAARQGRREQRLQPSCEHARVAPARGGLGLGARVDRNARAALHACAQRLGRRAVGGVDRRHLDPGGARAIERLAGRRSARRHPRSRSAAAVRALHAARTSPMPAPTPPRSAWPSRARPRRPRLRTARAEPGSAPWAARSAAAPAPRRPGRARGCLPGSVASRPATTGTSRPRASPSVEGDTSSAITRSTGALGRGPAQTCARPQRWPRPQGTSTVLACGVAAVAARARSSTSAQGSTRLRGFARRAAADAGVDQARGGEPHLGRRDLRVHAAGGKREPQHAASQLRPGRDSPRAAVAVRLFEAAPRARKSPRRVASRTSSACAIGSARPRAAGRASTSAA